MLLFQEITSVLIAIIALYIALNQYYIQKYKLNLDLYEKRFAIYSTIKEFLPIIIQKGEIDFNSLLEFKLETNKAIFFFKADINDHLKEIIENVKKEISCKVVLNLIGQDLITKTRIIMN